MGLQSAHHDRGGLPLRLQEWDIPRPPVCSNTFATKTVPKGELSSQVGVSLPLSWGSWL